MNRIEFMAELESLLKDIPAEERDEAVQYYRDYFEDAGIENEMQIIAELGSPQKVAQTIKEGLRGKNEESSEYRETGYADTRFEYKETPANRNVYENEKKQEKTNTLIKVLLIIAIVIVGAPVILPVALAVICVVFALGVSGFAVLGSLVIAAVCVAIAGIVMAVCGIIQLLAAPALGLVVCGVGMLLFVLGAVGTVLLVKLCLIVFPVLFRWIVNIVRKPLHRKENA